MTHTQTLVTLALKDLDGLTLTDREQEILALDLEEWKRILLLEVELKAKEVTQLEADRRASSGEAQRRIVSELQRLSPRLRDLRERVTRRVRIINDRMRQKNIVLANTRERELKRYLYRFLQETKEMIPFEEPYLDWHVRCAALLEET